VLSQGQVVSEIPRESLTEERLVRAELDLHTASSGVGAS